jgi:hypothetical protein
MQHLIKSKISIVKARTKCSLCGKNGHNKRTCKIVVPLSNNVNKNNTLKNTSVTVKINNDTYTEHILCEQYFLHKSYVTGRMETTKKVGIGIRLPSIPEDISENIIKFIIHNKCGDKTSRWDCKVGDLYSQNEGKQECKCFTSNGPLSFTPSTEWDVIYFLDARNWLNDTFVLYKSSLKRTSKEWKNIMVNKLQTFEEQCKQGRRPRINWERLYPLISSHCIKIYDGKFENICFL